MGTRYYESSTSGMNFDRFLDNFDESTVSKMKRKYWTAKQMIRTKLGQKEDEHLTASDAELDAKLTLLDSVKRTSEEMLSCVDLYQGHIVDAAEMEHELGRYLKKEGREEKREHLALALTALGRALNFSAHRRAAIRKPLLRFYDEMRVFYERAVADCSQTRDAVEKARTEYRGSLLWIKKSSQELDPESARQLDAFREAQAVVRANKERLDSLKTDALQKVDLLSASRVNLLLHLLGSYAELLHAYYEKTSSAFSAIASNLTAYEHYDFEILKDLVEPSRRIAEQVRQESMEKEDREGNPDDNINLLDLNEEESNLRDYLFGRCSPDEERIESPLGIHDRSQEEEEQGDDGAGPSQPPFDILSHLRIGPLAPLPSAEGEVPRLNPPPPGPSAMPPTSSLLPSLDALYAHSAPLPSQSGIGQLLDLSGPAFPNPFDDSSKTEWDELLLQCDAGNTENGLI